MLEFGEDLVDAIGGDADTGVANGEVQQRPAFERSDVCAAPATHAATLLTTRARASAPDDDDEDDGEDDDDAAPSPLAAVTAMTARASASL